jgi:putative oxidoreductase
MFMNRFKSICGWSLQLLLASFFVIQGIVKLTGSPAWISRFRAWGYPDRFYFVVGLAELLGAVLLLIPRLAKFGAVILIVVMVGATATHLIHGEPQIITTVVLATLLAIVLYMRWGMTTGAGASN